MPQTAGSPRILVAVVVVVVVVVRLALGVGAPFLKKTNHQLVRSNLPRILRERWRRKEP